MSRITHLSAAALATPAARILLVPIIAGALGAGGIVSFRKLTSSGAESSVERNYVGRLADERRRLEDLLSLRPDDDAARLALLRLLRRQFDCDYANAVRSGGLPLYPSNAQATSFRREWIAGDGAPLLTEILSLAEEMSGSPYQAVRDEAVKLRSWAAREMATAGEPNRFGWVAPPRPGIPAVGGAPTLQGATGQAGAPDPGWSPRRVRPQSPSS